MKKYITNYDEIMNLRPDELATFMEILSPVGNGFNFYKYVNDYVCNSQAKVCPLSKKECVSLKGKACPFSYKDKVHKWLISRSISRTEDILK